MKGTAPPFGNSDDMRAAAERSAEQFRSAFGILVHGAQKAVVAFEARMRAGEPRAPEDGPRGHGVGTPEDGTRAHEASAQEDKQEDKQEAATAASGSAAGDASSMLELVHKLGEAGDIQDLVRMQTAFVQAWIQILGEQARALAPAAGAIVEAVRADIGNHPPELDFAKAKQEAASHAPAWPGDRSDGLPDASRDQGAARPVTERDMGLELDTIAALLDMANTAVDEARASAASTIKDLARQ